MKVLRPTALVVLVAASFSSPAQPPKNVISLDQYAGFAYGGAMYGGDGGGGEVGQSLHPGRIHAASLTVTADPGAECHVIAGVRTDLLGDFIDVVDADLLNVIVKAGEFAPNSQTVSYAFDAPIEVNFNAALDDVSWVARTTPNTVGTCTFGGSVVMEGSRRPQH